ncbi:class II aldolase/adducin family protein [Acetobacter sp. DsW_063]|uniref:class II aldolase/adducin family protein n=1 Tax=Acetobacter sp. DsW_063 TaxID=1514894 RepID=UPI00130238EC|nr:class II aldolase/adducin family protein [Acetobacter sp. DsW_063]
MANAFQTDVDNARGALQLPGERAPAAEREHRKLRLAQALRVFGHLGFEHGLAGHFSARDPIDPTLFWINRLGTPFLKTRVSDLVLVDRHETIHAGRGPINRSGVPYHDTIQVAREDIVGIAHAHAFWGKTWSAFRRPVTNLTADASFFLSDQSLFDPLSENDGQVGRDQKAIAAAKALGRRNVLIWFNHGIWTVGRTVESAAWRFLAFEDAAHSQLVAEAAGVLQPPADSALEPDREQREIFAHFSFLALWDRISEDHEDVEA